MSDILDKYHNNLKEAKKFINDTYSEETAKNLIDFFTYEDMFFPIIGDDYFLNTLKSFTKAKTKGDFIIFNFYKFYLENIFEKDEYIAFQALSLAIEVGQISEFNINTFKKLFENNKFAPLTYNSLLSKGIINENENRYGRNKIKTVSLKHHTLTEFAVADLFKNEENPLDLFKAHAYFESSGIRDILSSWSGVLGFLFQTEYKSIMLDWILSTCEKNPKILDERLSSTLLFFNTDNKDLDNDIKERIFKLIFYTYQERRIWIPYTLSKKLALLISISEYKKLKALKTFESLPNGYILKGNIIRIIDHAIELNTHSYIQNDKNSYWKEVFIQSAKEADETGVVQRHSLSALENYNDPTIIAELISIYSNTKDTLVKQAFVRFAYITSPNSKETLNILIEAIKDDIFYSREGLYHITNTDSLLILLKAFSSDKNFVEGFTKHSSIYSEKDTGDIQIIKNIKKCLNKDILNELKNAVKFIVEEVNIFHGDENWIVQKFVELIKEQDQNYWKEIKNRITSDVEDEDKSWKYLYAYEHVLALLLTPDNLKTIIEELSPLPGAALQNILIPAIYFAKRNNENGSEVYKTAIDQKIIEEIPQQKKAAQIEEDNSTYKEFLKYLNPPEGKSNLYVLVYTARFYDSFKNKIKDEEINQLKKLTREAFEKIEPKDIKVNYNSKDKKGSYRISITAEYFSSTIKVANIICPKMLDEYRTKLINFIPYSYDVSNIIYEQLGNLKKTELRELDELYLNKEKDGRYLLPSHYIDFIDFIINKSYFTPTNSIEVLISFINDPLIEKYVQIQAIKELGKLPIKEYSELKKFFIEIFEKNRKNKDRLDFAEKANEILIKVYKDEKAINWRFKEIYNRLSPSINHQDLEVHWITPVEEEFGSMEFTQPLIDASDVKYLSKIRTILNLSIKILKMEDKDSYQGYQNYLWKFILNYFESLKKTKSIETIKIFDSLIKRKLKNDLRLNWLNAMYLEKRKDYVAYLKFLENV